MAQRDLLKAINRTAILNVIKSRGPISRTDIARLARLSPAAVTGLTAELINDGLIYEKQEGDSRGGRRPILLALEASGAYVIGIKLGEEVVTAALTDLNATVIARQTSQLRGRDPQTACDQIAESVDGLLHTAQVNRKRLLGVGVGIAGIVDSRTGLCHVSPYNGWVNVPFAALLEERLLYPVYIDNNVNTLTLAEQLYGSAQHAQNFLVITVGRGVGMGIVVNGQIYRGARGGAGEFGHIVIDPNGFHCGCGNRGCLETFVAEPWLLRRASMSGLAAGTPEELIAAADRGHPVAVDIFRQAGETLGKSIANVVNLLNPSLIVISGEGVRAGDHLFGPMQHTMQRHMFAPLAEDVTMRIEPLGDDTWARGTASLVLREIFRTPDLTHVPEAGD